MPVDDGYITGLEKAFWDKRFEKQDYLGEPNSFSKRVLPLIKERGYTRVLDLGCGDGRDTIFFAENDLDVVAVDYSKNALKKLAERNLESAAGNIECRVLDYSRGMEALSNDSFDVVYAHLSLQYFTDDLLVFIFKELWRVLRKDGLLLIKVKSTDDELYGRGELIENSMFLCDGRVRHFFGENYLKRRLEKFRLLEIKKTTEYIHQKQGRYLSTCFEAVAEK